MIIPDGPESPADFPTDHYVCKGCGRKEIHKFCPAWGTPFYMSGVPFSLEIEALYKNHDEIVKAGNAAFKKTVEQVNYIPIDESMFGCDFLHWPDNAFLASLLLYQSGHLKEFGPLDEGDQIEILGFEVTVFGIKIQAKLGDQTKVFYLKTQRTDENGCVCK